MVYKFVEWETPSIDKIKSHKAYIIHQKLENGEKVSREDKDFVFEKLQTNAYSRVGIPVSGYMIDFSLWLKSYIVRTKYWETDEVYSLDKTSIRKYYGSHNIRCICLAEDWK